MPEDNVSRRDQNDKDEEEEETSVRSNVTWMPMARDQVVPIAALATCHVNLHKGCNLQVEQKYANYLRSWQNPGPQHCQPKPLPEDQPIFSDRLGFNLDCDNFP